MAEQRQQTVAVEFRPLNPAQHRHHRCAAAELAANKEIPLHRKAMEGDFLLVFLNTGDDRVFDHHQFPVLHFEDAGGSFLD